ncbi:hypothetical protein JYU34_021316 [Plutella xylostella]|uniref:Uncharacterized protein n=1 Tax=Plutella xylostella TaxID=51655 RepID=A0ABQ7PTJ5_PLUXY|nr:uncharacterized protein LOC125489708 [Plutella xylostella]KAG7296210.1 hypothetical protein JYU34_021316 [Plutella xylostella]
MSQQLKELHHNINLIKEYLVKIGPERRKQQIAYKKLQEANDQYSKLDNILVRVNQEIKEKQLGTECCELLHKLISDVHITYRKIKGLLSSLDSSSQTEDIEHRIQHKLYKMADSFDIKTAISLLPVMTGQEQVTNQLIDGILLYSSLINDSSKNTLIDFVLKTRLSASAKLRLKSTYSNVQSLVDDIRKYLLPKKSTVALQTQLFSTTQGRRSIENFGTEIEELFVNLTIAQADGDSTKYDVLRPLNEKTAIKRFSDGLSDQRLSTIIASRQFESLPDAIRAALDEQSMCNQHQNQSLHFQDPRHTSAVPQSYYNNRGFRGRGNYHNTKYNKFNNSQDNKPGQRTFYRNVGRGNRYTNSWRGQAQGARGDHSRFQRVQHNDSDDVPNSEEVEFFRDQTE